MDPTAIFRFLQPFASALFYRNTVKKDVARQLMREKPNLTFQQAMDVAEFKIHSNEVSELDPTQPWKGMFQAYHKDPAGTHRSLLKIAVILFCGYWLLMGLGWVLLLAILSSRHGPGW